MEEEEDPTQIPAWNCSLQELPPEVQEMIASFLAYQGVLAWSSVGVSSRNVLMRDHVWADRVWPGWGPNSWMLRQYRTYATRLASFASERYLAFAATTRVCIRCGRCTPGPKLLFRSVSSDRTRVLCRKCHFACQRGPQGLLLHEEEPYMTWSRTSALLNFQLGPQRLAMLPAAISGNAFRATATTTNYLLCDLLEAAQQVFGTTEQMLYAALDKLRRKMPTSVMQALHLLEAHEVALTDIRWWSSGARITGSDPDDPNHRVILHLNGEGLEGVGEVVVVRRPLPAQ